MRILYAATDQRLETYHGGTVHVLSVARELARLQHRVLLVTQQPRGSGVTMPEGVEHKPIPTRHRYLLWSAGGAIDRMLEDWRPDVIMERYYNFSGEALLRGSRRGIPGVLEVNSPMIEYRGSRKAWVDLLLFNSMKRRRVKIGRAARLIIAPIRQIVPEELQDKVREMEWGADTELFDPALLPDKEILRMEKGFAANEILLVHFGSLRSWHGLDVLLKAFDLACSLTHKPLRLIIVGPAGRKARQAENVYYTGIVPHEDLATWLKISDIAVLPFSPERHAYLRLGFYWSPLKVFEAMAMEMPIVTLDHPRLREILGTDSPGFYYNGTAGGLADRILEMLEDLPVYQATGKAFRERLIRKYSWQAHAAKLSAWLTDLAVDSAGPGVER